MRDAFRMAVGTLTALPVRPPSTVAAPVPGRAMSLAPLVGLIPGVIAAAAAWSALTVGLQAPVAAVIVVGCFALSTRGLHLDGLADTADGLAASYDRVKALAVMRRGDTGPSGLAAVVLILLLQCAALSQVLQAATDAAVAAAAPIGAGVGVPALVLLVAVAARVAVPLACLGGVPSARPDGLGAGVAGSVGQARCALVLCAAAAACSAAAAISPAPWWSGLLSVTTVVMVTGLLLLRAIHRFGGVTGDVIGAGVEIGTAATLLVLAVCL